MSKFLKSISWDSPFKHPCRRSLVHSQIQTGYELIRSGSRIGWRLKILCSPPHKKSFENCKAWFFKIVTYFQFTNNLELNTEWILISSRFRITIPIRINSAALLWKTFSYHVNSVSLPHFFLDSSVLGHIADERGSSQLLKT